MFSFNHFDTASLFWQNFRRCGENNDQWQEVTREPQGSADFREEENNLRKIEDGRRKKVTLAVNI